MNSFYSDQELDTLGLSSFGKNVKISRNVALYSPETIVIGNNVRIDDFCILSGLITLKSNIHISAYCGLFGGGGIVIDDFSGLSPKTLIFSKTDDFSGEYMVGPMVPDSVRHIIEGKVTLEKYVQVGASSVILPNTTLHIGSATGACTLINQDLPAWSLSVGVPARVIKDRSKNILELVQKI